MSTNNKEEILLIECLSSGAMYVEEIIDRGYKALVINPYCDDQHVTQSKRNIVEEFKKKYSPDQFEAMEAPYDANAIVELVKDRNLKSCIVGSEYGVKLTDEVADKLGFKYNNPATTWCRCAKQGMVQSLKEAGLRFIKTEILNSAEDVERFWVENDVKSVFIKYSESAGSYGNRHCKTLKEAIEHYNKISNMKNYFGNDKDKILIQEFIEGDEYVVNTVSCQGEHILSDMWKYTKTPTDSGDVLYDSSRLVENIDEEECIKEMVDYAFKVVSAVDLKFGPCHGEYKVDHKGPVLIETNCRPMGDSTTRDYMLDISGQCIVDLSLDAHIEQEKFLKRVAEHKPYQALKSATKKYLILYKAMRGDMAAAFTIVEHLKTYHNHNAYEPAGIQDYPRTKDLGNTPMILKLAGDTKEDVKYDIDFMVELEKKYPELLVCPNPNLHTDNQSTIENIVNQIFDINDLTERADMCERSLVITDSDAYEVYKDKFTPVCEDTPKIFDCVIYANTADGTLNDKVTEIFDMFKYLKPGGRALCSDYVFEMLPYGKDCFEVLKKAARI